MKTNKKGFTLAELLIVVAIIGVLAGISIPIFTSQLEKSRDAVTISNLRAAYAQAQTAYLTAPSSGTADYSEDANSPVVSYSDGKIKTVAVKNVVAKGTKDGFGGADADLPFTHAGCAVMGSVAATNYTVTFSYDTDGKITGVTAATPAP
jgi:prepilin-type N-terminal cleavage/methylation domain-containing protein